MNAIRQSIRKFARKRLRGCIKTASQISARDMDAPSGIHNLRVALRRLENCVGLFGPMFSKGGAGKVLAELSAIRRQLGRVRDYDIVIQLVPQVSGSIEGNLLRDLLARRDRRLRKATWKRRRNASRWKKLLKV